MSEEKKREVPVTNWHGCFNDSWSGWLTSDAFAH